MLVTKCFYNILCDSVYLLLECRAEQEPVQVVALKLHLPIGFLNYVQENVLSNICCKRTLVKNLIASTCRDRVAFRR